MNNRQLTGYIFSVCLVSVSIITKKRFYTKCLPCRKTRGFAVTIVRRFQNVSSLSPQRPGFFNLYLAANYSNAL